MVKHPTPGARRSLRLRGRTVVAAALAMVAFVSPVHGGDRLLATGGVTQIEGAGGGGLVPWALIAGTGTADQIDAIATFTQAQTRGGFGLQSAGFAAGIHNRVEVSVSTLRLGLSDTVPGQSIRVDTIGLKVRLAGDAVYDQDSPWPQFSLGLQWKRNRDFDAVPRALGARSAVGSDIYVSASKIWLAGFVGRNLLANFTLRSTAANQFGILGFGGPNGAGRRLKPEMSVAMFLTDRLAIGTELRAKPDNLPAFREESARDVFVAWFPSRHLSVTAAWIDLGQIANKRGQTGWYVSAQLAF